MNALLVNADDLGMSDAVNDAVLDTIERGWCTGTSLLATGPAFADAARRVRIPVGVHLDLTEFEPITARMRRITGGRFAPGHRLLGDHDAILEEWEAQVARVRDAGLEVDHLDSHQHVHHGLVGVIRRLAERTGVRRVRGMASWRLTRWEGRVRPSVRGAAFRARLRALGLRTPDHFASVELWLTRARTARGVVELMVHPGNPAHARYADELRALAEGALGDTPRVGWSAV